MNPKEFESIKEVWDSYIEESYHEGTVCTLRDFGLFIEMVNPNPDYLPNVKLDQEFNPQP